MLAWILAFLTLSLWTGQGASWAFSPLNSKLALIQYDADTRFGDVAFNRSHLMSLAKNAADSGAQLIVFPEGSTTGYSTPRKAWCRPGLTRCEQRDCEDVNQVAERLADGPTTRFWESFARQRRVYVVYSLIEMDKGAFYNSVGAVGPQGFIGGYRKRSLYKIDRCFANEGERPFVLKTTLGDFGLMICMDAVDYPKRFYEEYRQLGVNRILLPMNWDEPVGSLKDASPYFVDKAKQERMWVYAADSAHWDGTGAYLPGALRQRDGLPSTAVNQEGISFHQLGSFIGGKTANAARHHRSGH